LPAYHNVTQWSHDDLDLPNISLIQRLLYFEGSAHEDERSAADIPYITVRTRWSHPSGPRNWGL